MGFGDTSTSTEDIMHNLHMLYSRERYRQFVGIWLEESYLSRSCAARQPRG